MNYTKTSINNTTQPINNKIGSNTQNCFSEGTKKRGFNEKLNMIM
ncbi:MAG: hypothetical protein U9R39_09420 [Campylobacterota bacterium]|nr:hypothetical protein [Campylobacterota bacterium]